MKNGHALPGRGFDSPGAKLSKVAGGHRLCHALLMLDDLVIVA
jgi:hypothetical protein